MARLIGYADVLGRAERRATVAADPPIDVAVGDGLEVVRPGERDEAAIGCDRAALIPVGDPSRGVGTHRLRWRPRLAIVIGPEVDDALEPGRCVHIWFVGLHAQHEAAVGETQDGVRERWRADVVRHRDRSPGRPGMARIHRVGDEDRHRQAPFRRRVEERLAGERVTIDPQCCDDEVVAVEARDRCRLEGSPAVVDGRREGRDGFGPGATAVVRAPQLDRQVVGVLARADAVARDETAVGEHDERGERGDTSGRAGLRRTYDRAFRDLHRVRPSLWSVAA